MTAPDMPDAAAQTAPATPISAPAALSTESNTLVDYRATIQRLEGRAAAARSRVKLVGLFLGLGVMLIAGGISLTITLKDFAASGGLARLSLYAKPLPTGGNPGTSTPGPTSGGNPGTSTPGPTSGGNPGTGNSASTSKGRVEPRTYGYGYTDVYTTPDTAAVLGIRVRGIVSRLKGPGEIEFMGYDSSPPPLKPEETQRLRVELKEALDDLEHAVKIEAQRRPDPLSSQLSSITSTVVFSVGAMVFVYLLIQIAIMFIRYHTRLAELYDAQADALRAAGGDAKLAYGFLQHFSPNSIELGATPTTLYEKALDVVKEIAVHKST